MILSPFLKNALWVAPASLLLAWSTPRPETKSDQPPLPTQSNRSNRTEASVPRSFNNPLHPTELLELTSVADCQKFLADLETRSDLHPLITSALRDRALRAWFDFDPAIALRHAEENIVVWGESFGKDLFRVALDLNPELALEHFNQISPALRDSLFQDFYKQLALSDPKRVLDFMKLDEPGRRADAYDLRAEVVAHSYGIWAGSDPIAALEHYQKNLALGAMPGFSRWSLTTIFQTWGESDPLSAWEYFRNLEKDTFDPYSLSSVEPILARFLLSDNPKLLSELEIPPQVATMLWAEADLPGALEFADSLPKEHQWRAHFLVQAAERLATSDPARALSLYLEGQSFAVNPDNPLASAHIGFADSFYHNTFQILNAGDRAHAHELLQSVPEEHRALALGGILTQEFAKDPATAISRIQEYYQDPAARAMVDKALTRSLEWGGQNPTEVIAAIPEARALVKGDLLESWTRKDPEAAATFISEELVTNPKYRIQNEAALAHLAAARPEFTAQWLQTLPEGQIQTNAAVALAANWSNFDRPATEAWIAQLPAGPVKNAASKTLSRQSD